jgi:DNA excision repair protein ERCC-4
MYAKQLLLWPRFHASVTATLSKHTPDLVELKQPVTDSMATLQKAIFEIMDTCLKELKLTNQVISTFLILGEGDM